MLNATFSKIIFIFALNYVNNLHYHIWTYILVSTLIIDYSHLLSRSINKDLYLYPTLIV